MDSRDWPLWHKVLQHTDIYLLDLILKGRADKANTVLDAGCGHGRNLPWFLVQGKEVWGTDRDALALDKAHAFLNGFAALPRHRLVQCAVEEMPGRVPQADFVVCNAVLHFARDQQHWQQMVDALWACLAPGGTLFCRLMATRGIKERLKHINGNIWQLPDGSARYHVDDSMLLRATHRLGGRFVEPLKTVVVEDQRAMCTWVVGKE